MQETLYLWHAGSTFVCGSGGPLQELSLVRWQSHTRRQQHCRALRHVLRVARLAHSLRAYRLLWLQMATSAVAPIVERWCCLLQATMRWRVVNHTARQSLHALRYAACHAAGQRGCCWRALWWRVVSMLLRL